MTKEFNDIMPGDIATDYNGDTYRVVDKGEVAEMLKKYPNCPQSLEDWTDYDGTEQDPVLVVEESNPGFEGYTHIIYTHGPEGAEVYV